MTTTHPTTPNYTVTCAAISVVVFSVLLRCPLETTKGSCLFIILRSCCALSVLFPNHNPTISTRSRVTWHHNCFSAREEAQERLLSQCIAGMHHCRHLSHQWCVDMDAGSLCTYFLIAAPCGLNWGCLNFSSEPLDFITTKFTARHDCRGNTAAAVSTMMRCDSKQSSKTGLNT